MTHHLISFLISMRVNGFTYFRLLVLLTLLTGLAVAGKSQDIVDGEKNWNDDFEVVDIASEIDGRVQKAYFYRAQAESPRPLIVSLHTWSGSYTQRDSIADLSKKEDVHYLHPDFRGPNNSSDACCSPLALNDIDAAISWAIAHADVDTSRIYVIGVSGGGYATLSTFMTSKHPIRKFSAWASITDLVAWYEECRIRKSKYAEDILQCTNSSKNQLNIEEAKDRSPLYWQPHWRSFSIHSYTFTLVSMTA